MKDVAIIQAAKAAIEDNKEISLEYTIANTDRAVGAMLSGTIATKTVKKDYQHTLNIKFKGSAGQSFGALFPESISNWKEKLTTI